MWKPGTTAPSRNIHKRGREEGDDSRKYQENHSEEIADNGNGTSKPPSGTPTEKKKAALSGATMNMKFMQRKMEQRSFEKKHQQQVEMAASSSLDVSMADADGGDNDGGNSDNSDGPPHIELPQDTPVSLTPASSADMYGISVGVIGRRSFGGFNRAIEDTWKASYRSHKEGSGQKSSRGERATDEELLQRYASLVKDRRGGGDKSRSPVGNLAGKGQRNKPRNSGEKRKRR